MNQALSLCISLVSEEDQHEAAYLSVLRVQVLRLMGRQGSGGKGMTYAEFNKRVTAILDRVEVAANNTAWLINRHLDTPDLMFEYSRRILENNPDLNGCSIAFEPNFFPGRGRYFSAYSYNNNGVIETTQEGNEHYEYFYLDWYQLCKLLDRPVWTEPFMDYHPEGIYSKDMLASYCQPMKDKDGKYIGTLSVDLSLSWLSNTISAVKPYPNSYSIMIGQGGTYFVHPDSTKLVYQTIFTESMEHPDTAMVSLGHAMQRGEEGMRQLKVNGEDCYVFFKPLSTTGWSVAIVCPESDIFVGFNKLRRSVTGTVIGGLLLLMLVVYHLSRSIARLFLQRVNLSLQQSISVRQSLLLRLERVDLSIQVTDSLLVSTDSRLDAVQLGIVKSNLAIVAQQMLTSQDGTNAS